MIQAFITRLAHGMVPAHMGGGLSLQTGRDGHSWNVWMIIRMIKRLAMKNRMDAAQSGNHHPAS
jgi:hypothetical protein